MVKNFPDWGDIGLEDRSVYVEFAEREQPVTSEMSFDNLFVWRYSYNFRTTIIEDAFCLLAHPRGQAPFFLPPMGALNPADVVRRLFDYLGEEGIEPCIRRAPERLVASLTDPSLQAVLDRDHSDYVYLASDLANLAGRRYSKKRNQISQFRSKYQYEYRRITPDLLPLCADLQVSWCDARDCFHPDNTSLAEENEAVMEALGNYEALGLVGGAILIDGKVEAFTIGGPLNNDTFVIHLEKGNPSIPGIYQVVNQAFCADACVGYTFINREQDLGDAGLRQAKRSYFPHHMIEKFVISPRG
jgi:uncharacterized protein